MNIVYLSGSPRKKSNTDCLLNHIRGRTGGDFVKLSEYRIEPCTSCWACVRSRTCVIDDDMTTVIVPKILAADAIVIGSPVYFNNVTAQMKAFMDRTWPLRSRLKNKIGAAVVVGRKYGAESAITAITAFFLKHEMIVANRGISGTAYAPDEITHDVESFDAAAKLGDRILELGVVFRRARGRGAVNETGS